MLRPALVCASVASFLLQSGAQEALDCGPAGLFASEQVTAFTYDPNAQFQGTSLGEAHAQLSDDGEVMPVTLHIFGPEGVPIIATMVMHDGPLQLRTTIWTEHDQPKGQTSVAEFVNNSRTLRLCVNPGLSSMFLSEEDCGANFAGTFNNVDQSAISAALRLSKFGSRAAATVATAIPLLTAGPAGPGRSHVATAVGVASLFAVCSGQETESGGDIRCLGNALDGSGLARVVIEVEIRAPMARSDSPFGTDWFQVEAASADIPRGHDSFLLRCPGGYNVTERFSTPRGSIRGCNSEEASEDTEQQWANTREIWDAPRSVNSVRGGSRDSAPDDNTVGNLGISLFSHFNGTIMVDCFTINGNGFDWASSISVITETLNQRARIGEEEEQRTGRGVLMYLDCMVGGSSGSAVMGVYRNLLKNEEIWKGEAEPPYEVDSIPVVGGRRLSNVRLYRPAHVRKLSRLLRFIALGLDFTRAEIAMFLPYHVRGDIIRCPDQKLLWWDQCFSPDAIYTLFQEHALMAKYATGIDFESISVRDMLEESGVCWLRWGCVDHLVAIAEEYGLTDATGVLMADVSRDNEELYEDLMELYLAQHIWARKAGHRINSRLYRMAGNIYSTRLVRASIDGSTPINNMMRELLNNGMCASAIMVPFDSHDAMMASIDTRPLYENTRVAFICNHDTANMILANERYRTDVHFGADGTAPMLHRYVILVASTYLQAFDIACREPFMLPINAERLADMGIESFYDPNLEYRTLCAQPGPGQCLDVELQFQLRSTSMPVQVFDESSVDYTMAVLGGYPPADIMAFMNGYLAESIFLSMQSAAHAVSWSEPRSYTQAKVDMRHTRFMKTVAPAFALRVIRNLLSGNDTAPDYDDRAQRNLADWDTWNELYSSYWEQSGRFQEHIGGELSWAEIPSDSTFPHPDDLFETKATMVDWGIEGALLPRAVAGQSYWITARAVAAAHAVDLDVVGAVFPADHHLIPA